MAKASRKCNYGFWDFISRRQLVPKTIRISHGLGQLYHHLHAISLLFRKIDNLCSPNEDLGRPNKRFGPCFQTTFNIREYFIWATDHWKVLWKHGPKRLFGLPKSSFGERKVATKDHRIAENSTSHVATLFCNHLAKLLQKFIASQKTSPHMLLLSFVIILHSLCSPNEDFGRPNQPFRVRFRSTFQGCEYCIWATKRWKVLRKLTRKGWFGLPKSSFGEHKVVTKDHNIAENQPLATHTRFGQTYRFTNYPNISTEGWKCDFLFATMPTPDLHWSTLTLEACRHKSRPILML